MSEITRRDFFTRAAGAVAAFGFAAGESVQGAARLGGRMGRAGQGGAADLVVVGGGLAGLAAAITAADLGARVRLVDKRYKIGGTAMGAGGSFSAAGSRQQKARNIQDSPDLHFQEANRIGRGRADPALLRLYTEQAAPTQAWLESLGVEFDPKSPRFAPEHELYSVPRTSDAKGGGPGYIQVLGRQLDRRIADGRVTLAGETTGTELVVRQGRVVGLRVTDDEGAGAAIDARAVILACGGYGANRAMVTRYNPSLARALTIASKYATGDGIRMAEAAGAALINMDLLVPYFAGVENPLGSGRTMMNSLISTIVPFFRGDIWVSREGTRFVNEDSPSPDERERALRGIPDAAVFALFDEAMLKANKPPLASFDAHLAAGRVVKRAGTIAELAGAIGVPAARLVQTIDTYNGYVEAGRDADFGRKDLIRIAQPPFYAIVASGVIFMTGGGVKTTTKMEAVRSSGEPIAGLYAAGEVQGAAQWMGDGLMGGAGNGAALVYGKLAAEAAVAAARA